MTTRKAKRTKKQAAPRKPRLLEMPLRTLTEVNVIRTPSFIFQQRGGCIIEEQDDYIVLAVRIQKSTIHDNLPLLMAIAGCSAPSPQVQS